MAADINTSISELVTSLDSSTAAITAATTAFNSGVLQIVNGLSSINCSVCPPTGTHPPTTGITEGDPPPAGWEVYNPVIVNRKCKLANMFFDDLRAVTSILEANDIDAVGYLAIGSMTALLGLVMGLIASGPIGWGLGALGAIAAVVAFFLVNTIDLDDLIVILDNNRDDLVCSLYDAVTPEAGMIAFKAALTLAGANATQLAYLDAINIVVGLEALFFVPDGAYGDDIEERLDGYVALTNCWLCGDPGDPCPIVVSNGIGTVTYYGNEFVISSVPISTYHKITLITPGNLPGSCGGGNWCGEFTATTIDIPGGGANRAMWCLTGPTTLGPEKQYKPLFPPLLTPLLFGNIDLTGANPFSITMRILGTFGFCAGDPEEGCS